MDKVTRFELSHKNVIPPERTLTGVAGDFAELYPDYPSRESLYLGFKVYAGWHLGRKGWVVLNGRRIFANLFGLVVTDEYDLNLLPLQEFFRRYPGPLVLSAGATTGASLIQPIRDPIVGPAKVFTGRDEDPEFRNTTLDLGEVERRLLIDQPRLLTTRIDPAFANCLFRAFHGSDLAVYGGHRALYMRSTNPHVALFTTCSPANLYKVEDSLRECCVVLDSANPSIDVSFGEYAPRDWSGLQLVRLAFEDAMKRPPSEINIASEAVVQFQALARSVGPTNPFDVVKAVKLALVDVMLERGRILDRAHASAAVLQVEKSRSAGAAILASSDVQRNRSRIYQALCHAPNGLTRTELNDLFSRNLKSDQIEAILKTLAGSGQVFRGDRQIQQRGRPPERWYAIPEGRVTT